jgi:hypothetical protein
LGACDKKFVIEKIKEMGNLVTIMSHYSEEHISRENHSYDVSTERESSDKNKTLLRKKIEKLCQMYGYEDLGKEKLEELMQDYMISGLKKKIETSKERVSKLTVKFIVSCLPISKKDEILSGLLGIFQKTYGPVHTCIQIGPYVLHWNHSSLVKIDVFKSTNSLLALEIDLTTKKSNESIIYEIIRFVADYNMNKKYDIISCNCQKFVDDVLKVIGIDDLKTYFMKKELSQNFKKFEEYKNRIKNENDRKIFDNLKVSYLFDTMIKSSLRLFNKHNELDKFVKRIIKNIYPNEENEEGMRKFRLDCPVQYDILKSSDRAFWLKLENDLYNTVFTSKLNEKLPYLSNNGMCKCPFKSPIITGTIHKDNS